VTAIRCYLALGSNLGDRLANLQCAVRMLAPAVTVEAVSDLYESEPVGPGGRSPYFNAACAAATGLTPFALLDCVKTIEWALGRRPGQRWGPRPADIDILLLDGVALDAATLTIPHPRIAERPFVLRPLADVAPDLILAGGGTVRAAAGAASSEGLARIAGPEWLRAVAVQPAALRPDPATL
jgi:2-amino-4-hydroxy-6-hydroxymethyldihydropteridine diphosphokinase